MSCLTSEISNIREAFELMGFTHMSEGLIDIIHNW